MEDETNAQLKRAVPAAPGAHLPAGQRRVALLMVEGPRASTYPEAGA
jgi:hypothetical protein